jgi:hypothetical protein
MTNALSTEKEIREDILENWKWIVEEKYPEDYITQLAESQCPVYNPAIIAEWIQLPSENSNKFSEIMSDIDDSISIEGLMATDLYLYYTNEYSRIYYEITEEKKKEESND